MTSGCLLMMGRQTQSLGSAILADCPVTAGGRCPVIDLIKSSSPKGDYCYLITKRSTAQLLWKASGCAIQWLVLGWAA